MDKLLITGSNGFLGRQLYDYFSKNFEIYTLSNLIDDKNKQKHFDVDLVNSVPNFTDLDFNLVIHAAGLAHFIPKTESDSKKFFDVNYEGTKRLIEGLSNANIPKYFVFISTVSVYGCSSGDEISENTELQATDPYGKSKIFAEEYLTSWAIKNNVILTILRPTLIFGASAPGNLFAMENAIKKGYYFSIGKGDAKRSSIHIADIGPVIKTLYLCGGVYNLCSDEKLKIRDFENYFKLKLGKKYLLKIPISISLILAQIGNLIELFTKREFIFSVAKFKKLTSNLTFSNDKIKKTTNYKFRSVFNKNIVSKN